jgi:tripartite-type tricarboxylate transporter receptor subunit TctC
MLKFHFAAGLLCFAFHAVDTGTAHGQNYPTRPLRIVTGGAGGASDFGARIIAQGISGPLGQQVIVDNRGAGIIAPAIVAKAQPDGYTLLHFGSTMWLFPYLKENVPYDPVKDFHAVTWVSSAPNILAINPAVAASSVKDLIALAKARPGNLNYAAAGDGGSAHLAAELFKSMAGVNIVYVPYKSAASALADLIGGQVQMTFGSAGSIGPHVKSGRLKALAVSSLKPTPLLPGVPTIAESGVPGYVSLSVQGVFAPARTPLAVINRLNRELVKVLNLPDVKEKVFNSGVETVGSTPEEFASMVKSEMARMGKVIKDGRIRAD